MPTPILLADTAWLLQLVTSGGPLGIALLVLLVLLSLASLALAVEQFASLRPARLAPAGLAERVGKLLESGDLDGAQRVSRDGSVLGAVLNAAIDEANQLAASPEPAWPAIEKTMEDRVEAESARLMRRLDYLALIGNLAPMIGLLGTVVGMIVAFREVAATQGAATAGELASGIYQALVTTVGGLIVAIPSLAVFHVLRHRLDALMATVVEQAERATRPIKRALSSAGPARLAAPPRAGRTA